MTSGRIRPGRDLGPPARPGTADVRPAGERRHHLACGLSPLRREPGATRLRASCVERRPGPAGRFSFASGMNVIHGSLVIEPAPAHHGEKRKAAGRANATTASRLVTGTAATRKPGPLHRHVGDAHRARPLVSFRVSFGWNPGSLMAQPSRSSAKGPKSSFVRANESFGYARFRESAASWRPWRLADWADRLDRILIRVPGGA